MIVQSYDQHSKTTYYSISKLCQFSSLGIIHPYSRLKGGCCSAFLPLLSLPPWRDYSAQACSPCLLEAAVIFRPQPFLAHMVTAVRAFCANQLVTDWLTIGKLQNSPASGKVLGRCALALNVVASG